MVDPSTARRAIFADVVVCNHTFRDFVSSFCAKIVPVTLERPHSSGEGVNAVFVILNRLFITIY